MEKEPTEEFQRKVVAFMKEAKTWQENATRSILLSNKLFSLTPLSRYHLEDDLLIEKLSTWRDQHQYAYPSRFSVTIGGTKRWLETQVVKNTERLLFLLVDQMGYPIGHVGLLLCDDSSEIELDNILRGESDPPGVMNLAISALEEYAYRELGIDTCKLKVLKSNTHAIRFYEGLGYQAFQEIPLLLTLNDDESSTLTPVESNSDQVDDSFVVMRKSIVDSRKDVERILTAGPSIGPLERTYCLDAVANGWNSHHSDYITQFEKEFASYIGAQFAIATSSCTGALHLALLALGIGEGDEVIVPEITWVATASAVAYVGATPVFCDVDSDTWCISVENIRSLITPKTRAIVPVHLYGFPAAMNEITDLAKEFGLQVVEDAAPAIGAYINDRTVGSFGDFGCFSFQGAKMLVTGEGGMLVTSNADLYERAKKLQDHGRKPGTFWIEEVGRKYKMSNQTAALGLAQLERAELQIARKRQIAEWYSECLSEHDFLSFQKESSNSRSIFWMNSIRISEDCEHSRDEVIDKLAEEGIDTRPVFPAISTYPIWKHQYAPAPRALDIGSQSINLPSGVLLSRASVERVSNSIKKILAT
jgi:perosamine synthetase